MLILELFFYCFMGDSRQMQSNSDRAVKSSFIWEDKLFSTQPFGHIAQDVVEVGICWFQLRLNALRDTAIQNKSKYLKQQVCFSTVINHVITGVSDWICFHPWTSALPAATLTDCDCLAWLCMHPLQEGVLKVVQSGALISQTLSATLTPCFYYLSHVQMLVARLASPSNVPTLLWTQEVSCLAQFQ